MYISIRIISYIICIHIYTYYMYRYRYSYICIYVHATFGVCARFKLSMITYQQKSDNYTGPENGSHSLNFPATRDLDRMPPFRRKVPVGRDGRNVAV